MKSKTMMALSVVGCLAGLAGGVGVYTFIYAQGGSYLTNRPEACANCHVMQDHYNAWRHSTHHAVATCNDCHTPENPVGKYLNKANNGFWHSFAFTTGRYPEPIRIKGYNRDITEASCRKCHDDMVTGLGPGAHGGDVSCIRCHGAVGHPR